MAQESISIPKTYRDGQILYERDLEAVRRYVETALRKDRLNLEQLKKDIFTSGWDYDNTGLGRYATSIEDRLNQIINGGSAITGTASPTWTIHNNVPEYLRLDSTGLTGGRTFTFPDTNDQVAGIAATQTLTNKTLTNPTINSATVSGILTGPFDINGTVNLNAGDFTIDSTRKLFFDGGSDSYFYEAVANQINVVTGGGTSFIFGVNAVAVPAANKIYLDGGVNTSIRESVADTITFETNGIDRVSIGTTVFRILSSLDLSVDPTKRLYLDGGGDTYINQSSANVMSLFAGGVASLVLGLTSASLPSGNRLYFDGGSNTSIRMPSADVLSFETAGTSWMSLGSTGTLTLNTTGGADVALSTVGDLSILGKGNTTNAAIDISKIVNSASNVLGLRVQLSNAGAGLLIGADFSTFNNPGAGHRVLSVATNATDPTGGGGAATGRIPIDVGGVLRYIPYY